MVNARWQDIGLIRPHYAVPIHFAVELICFLSEFKSSKRISVFKHIQMHQQKIANTIEYFEQTWLMPMNYGELLGYNLAIY